MKKVEFILLLFLLLVALILRVAYLDWGIYGKETEINNEKYILKDLVPDEGDELSLARNIYEHKNPFLMQYFTTGPLYPYLILLFSGIYSVFFQITQKSVWLLIRLVNILISLASIFVLYKIGKLFNNRVAGVSSLILAFSPLAIRDAKWISPYNLLLLLTALVIFYALKSHTQQKNKDFLLLGIFVGLAFLTKYITIFLLIIPILLFLKNKRILYTAIPVTLSIAFLLFLVFYNFQAFGHFLSLQSEWGKHNLTSQSSYTFLFTSALTTPIFIISLFGFILWLKKRETRVFLLTIIALYFILELSNLKSSRFVFVSLPFFYLASAQVFDYLYRKVRILTIVLLILVFLNSLFYSLAVIDLFDISKEPRIQTAKLVYTLPKDTDIGIYNSYSEGKLEPIPKLGDYKFVDYSTKPEYIIMPYTTLSLWKNYFNLKSKGIEANWAPFKIPTDEEIVLFDSIVNEREYFVFKNFKNDVKFLFDYNKYDDPNDFINREIIIYKKKE